LIEAFLFGLRMNKGVDLDELKKQFGESLDQKRIELLDEIVGRGLLIRRGNRICASKEGMLLLDEISACLV